MKTIFLLFQTDLHKSKSSRVLFGAFDTQIKAIDAAKENNLYSHESEIEIVEVDINQFTEI